MLLCQQHKQTADDKREKKFQHQSEHVDGNITNNFCGFFFSLFISHRHVDVENHFYANWKDGQQQRRKKTDSLYLQKLLGGDIPFNVFSWKNRFPIKTVSCCGWPSFRVNHIEIFSTKRYECCHRVHIRIDAHTHTDCLKLCLCSTAAKWSSCLPVFCPLLLLSSCVWLTQELFAGFSAFVQMSNMHKIHTNCNQNYLNNDFSLHYLLTRKMFPILLSSVNHEKSYAI